MILSTRNPSKALQIKAMFAELNVPILTLDEAGIKGQAIEDGKTLLDNAVKKAKYAHDKLIDKDAVIADDTGLFINALNGAPGVRSARWAGEKATTEEITQHTLKMLEGVKDRTAIFETVVAVITPYGNTLSFNGTVRGRLLEEPRVKPQPDMPYSSIFVPDGETMVWAEMTTEYENRISHRGKALKRVLEFFKRARF